MGFDAGVGGGIVLVGCGLGYFAAGVASGGAGFVHVESFDSFGGAVEVLAFGADVGCFVRGFGLPVPAGGFFFCGAHFGGLRGRSSGFGMLEGRIEAERCGRWVSKS